MPYTIKHDPSSGIIEVIYTGRIAGADFREGTSACISLQKSSGATLFLVDLDGSEVGASTLEIYDLPDKQYREEQLDVRSRIAVIPGPNARAREAALFFQAACRNRGWNARVVPDHQAAIDWLRSP